MQFLGFAGSRGKELEEFYFKVLMQDRGLNMFKKSPERCAREKWHKLLDNGHKFAVVHKKTGKIHEAARRESDLIKHLTFRPELEIVNIEAKLKEIPMPAADMRVTTGGCLK